VVRRRHAAGAHGRWRQTRNLGTLSLVNDLQAGTGAVSRRVLAGAGRQWLVILLSALGSVAVYQLIVTRRLLAMAATIAGRHRAGPARHASAVASHTGATRRGDELDELAASIATLQATGRQALHDSDNEHRAVAQPDEHHPRPGVAEGRWKAATWPATRASSSLSGVSTKTACRGKTDFDLVCAEMAAAFRDNDQAGHCSARAAQQRRVAGPSPTAATTRPVRDPQDTHADPEGRTIGVLGIARDVTGQRSAVQALRDREELYRTIVSQAADGIALIDPADGCSFTEFNDAACSAAGLHTRRVCGHDAA
jgi:PAS domain-containing protein